MKLLRSSGKLKRHRLRDSQPGLFLIRRVAGDSMLPTLAPGKLVVGAVYFRDIHEGDIVILRHNGLEKIKRIARIEGDRLFVIGDNPEKSTDSRSFGWLSVASVRARVVWPKRPAPAGDS